MRRQLALARLHFGPQPCLDIELGIDAGCANCGLGGRRFFIGNYADTPVALNDAPLDSLRVINSLLPELAH